MPDTESVVQYRRRDAERVFSGVSDQGLALAVLARIQASEVFEGCVIFMGARPSADDGTVCIGVRGDAAAEVMLALTGAFGSIGIPASRTPDVEVRDQVDLARCSDGQWRSA